MSTLTFDSDGGTPIPSISGIPGTLVEKPKDPMKANYTFIDWSPSLPAKFPSVNQNYTAKWRATLQTEVSSVKVSFDSMGGTIRNPKYLSIGSKYGTLDESSRIGYAFSGWYTSKSYTTKVTSDTIVSNKLDHILYAKWIPNEYNIEFFSRSLETLIGANTKTVTYNERYGSLPYSEKKGHIFVGWENGDGKKITAETIFDTPRLLRLTAIWQPKSILIKFAKVGSNEFKPISRNYGERYGELPKPTLNGYTFKFWKTQFGSSVDSDSILLIDTDHELFPIMNANSYTVTFIDGSQVILNKNVLFNEPYGELPIVTKSGFTFAGWKDESGNIINKDSKVTLNKNHSIIATWTSDPYSLEHIVTFNGNGGTPLAQTRVKQGRLNLNMPQEPTRNGYMFAGWNTQISGTGQAFTSATLISSNTTVYAQWKPIDYFIVYNLGGGTNHPDNIKNYNITTNFTFREPTATGYYFDGWWSQLVGGAKITSIQSGSTGNLTLYARWSSSPVDQTISDQKGVKGLFWYSKLSPQGHGGDYKTNPMMNWDDTNLDLLHVPGYQGDQGNGTLLSEKEVINNWGCFVASFANILRNAGAISVDKHVDFRKGMASTAQYLIPDPFTFTLANLAEAEGVKLNNDGWPKIEKIDGKYFITISKRDQSSQHIGTFNAFNHFKYADTGKTVSAIEDNRKDLPTTVFLKNIGNQISNSPEGVAVKFVKENKRKHMIVFLSYKPEIYKYLPKSNPNGLDPRDLEIDPIKITPIIPGPPNASDIDFVTSDELIQDAELLSNYNWSLMTPLPTSVPTNYDEEDVISTHIIESNPFSRILNSGKSDDLKRHIYVNENASEELENGFNVTLNRTRTSTAFSLDHMASYVHLQ